MGEKIIYKDLSYKIVGLVILFGFYFREISCLFVAKK